MFTLFILINLIYNTIESNLGILIDKAFKKSYITNSISLEHCNYYNEDSFYYRGKPTNIKEIIDSNEINDLDKYECVYIPELKYFQNVTLFYKSTIFLNTITNNQSYYNNNFCIIKVDDNIDEDNYKSLYMITIGKSFDKNTEQLALIVLIIFFFFNIIIILVLNFRTCCLKFYHEIYVYTFARAIIGFSFMNYITCLSINYYLLFILLYCLYKSFIFINLYFLIDGFSIIDNDFRRCTFWKYFLFFFLCDSLSSLFFIYIVYFIPSINNFYFFSLKNITEHILLLIHLIKSIKKKFIPLYKQYKIEKRLRTIFAISYKIKLIIYIKILAFGFIYCIAFILLPFIEIIYSLNHYIEIFYYNYYFNIGLELFFELMVGVIFFPLKLSILYYLPIHYDYNSRILKAKIDKENERNNNISSLSKNILKKKFVKENLPIVLLNPFSNENNVINNLHIGLVKNKK